jgi:hypothetical protein
MAKILKWRIEGDNFVYTNEGYNGYSKYKVENKNGVIKVTLYKDKSIKVEEYTLKGVSIVHYLE